MNLIFMTVISMSLSGMLLILALLPGGRLLKGKLGRQWQYYIWLVVVIRLFLPFGPEASLMGQVHRVAEQAIVQMAKEGRLTGQSETQGLWQNKEPGKEQSARQNSPQFTEREQDGVVTGSGESMPTDSQGTTGQDTNRNVAWVIGSFFLQVLALAENCLWVIWLAVAFGMLIRKISMYQSYMKYVKAGAAEVCDIALLDRLAATADQLGVSRTMELCVNPLVASPMLVGYFHPCVVLPRADVPEKEFCWIAMHELTHYKRRDILYKWLVQFAVCLHWFNPLVHWMSREIDRACEFACDEAVVGKMG